MKIQGALSLGLLLFVVYTQCTTKKEDKPQAADSSAANSSAADSSAIGMDALITSLNESAILCTEIAKIASRSTNQDIRAVAENLVNVNSALLKEIQDLAAMKNVQLPDSLDSDNLKRVNAVNKKTGAEFDKRIMRMILSEQRTFFTRVRQTRDLKDPGLDAFAKRNMETLMKAREDLRSLQKVTSERSNADDERPS
jgi:putative membrane protein